MNIWDFWANKYDKLWVQKYSLRPTRDYITSLFDQEKPLKILDLGCGPGELLAELSRLNPSLDLSGLDSSKAMLDISKKTNKRARHILMDAKDLSQLEGKYHIIISTHSLPYYKNPKKVIKDLSNLLEDDGLIYMGFASETSLYDKIALFFVKFTTGPASYPSDTRFRQMLEGVFRVEELKIIRVKKYMPKIAVYTLKKVKK